MSRRANFEEVVEVMTEEEARQEAARCLGLRDLFRMLSMSGSLQGRGY